MYKKLICLVSSLLVSLSLFTGAASSQSTDPMSVRIAWQPGFAARLFVARELGLFEKAGLEPTFLKFVSGPPMLAALRSGDVDVAFMSVNPFLAGLAQGIEMQLFVVGSDELRANGLVVRPDSGIEKLTDIRGKTVGVTRGSASYYGLKKAMAANGLTDADVDVLDMAVPTWIPAFQSGDVDALWVWSPWLFKIEDIGGKTVATLADAGISLMQNVYVARNQWLADNPEAAVRFVHTIDLATDALASNRDVAKSAVADALGTTPEQTERLFSVQTFARLDEMVDPSWSSSLVGAEGARRGLTDQASFMFNEGFFNQMPDLSTATNPTPVETYLETKN